MLISGIDSGRIFRSGGAISRKGIYDDGIEVPLGACAKAIAEFMCTNDVKVAQESPVPAGPIPPDEKLSFLQYFRTIRDNAVAGYHQDVYRESIVEVRRWRLSSFIVNDPAAIKHVLIDNADNYVKGMMEIRVLPAWPGQDLPLKEERYWRQRRGSMSAPFDHRSWQTNLPLILDAAQSVLNKWSALPPGAIIEATAEMYGLALDIICRIVFSSDSAEFIRIMERAFQKYQAETNLDLLDLAPLLDGPWRRYKLRKHKQIFEELNNAIRLNMAKRAASSSYGKNDFLGLLLTYKDPETDSGLSAEEMLSQVNTILGAGHETVALTLMWIWYLLALHPQVEAKLHAELDQVLAGRQPALDDLAELPYARRVIEETLRLYPPFHTLAWRRSLMDDDVCGVKIPRGSTISIVPWVLHRHLNLWENPTLFDPDRFLPERSKNRSRFSYLPFGLGPRVCIGASFAMTEIMLLLAIFAQHFRVRLAPGQQVEAQALITLKARHGLKVTLERR